MEEILQARAGLGERLGDGYHSDDSGSPQSIVFELGMSS